MAGRAAGEAPILDIWVSAEFFAAAKTSRLFPAGILAPKAAQLVVEAKRRAAIFKEFFCFLIRVSQKNYNQISNVED